MNENTRFKAEVQFGTARDFPVSVPVIIIGAGACGLIAALATHDAGVEALLLERDAQPSGSTALSSGFIPACGTRWQAAVGISDSVELMVGDILRKTKALTDPTYVEVLCRESGQALEWLNDSYGLSFNLLTGFTYPGHSVLRMHAMPARTGRALIDGLSSAVVDVGINIMTNAIVERLFALPGGRIVGVEVTRPDGTRESIGCGALVLACNGYGGNPQLLQELIPEMADALYFGHPGNQGHAVAWGRALGARLDDLGAYQGHGSVAIPHGALITWAIMMEGGIQLNSHGDRFSNEHQGYSEQAVAVLDQPGQVAWTVFDERLHQLALEFEDYRQAETAGAVRTAVNSSALAETIGAPPGRVAATLCRYSVYCDGGDTDPYGRDFRNHPQLEPPYRLVKVTGALFHTQGGLRVDADATVLRNDGGRFDNLYAGGGAARGVSGPAVWGYLSGNGLLSAVTLGRIAGVSAARVGRDGSARFQAAIS